MRTNRRSKPGSRWHRRVTFAVAVLAAAAAAPRTAGADAPSPAAAPRPAHVVETVHAWKEFLAYAREASGAAEASARGEIAERAYAGSPDGAVSRYFAARGGGDRSIALGDWLGLPPAAFAPVTAALSEPGAQAALERDAVELARRFAPYGGAGDTTVFVYLVGDFSNPFTTWFSGRTQFVAIQLETFVPAPEDSESREAIELAVQSRPDSLPVLAEVAPWAAFAATRQFVPELRERVGSESASLAEFALMHGLSARFARALYPGSVFGRGVGAQRAATARALEPIWSRLGTAWFPHGTKPYSAARYEAEVTAAVPEGVSLDAAVIYVGARMAEQWLHATRIGRETDEPGQISRQGRVPTLSAWSFFRP